MREALPERVAPDLQRLGEAVDVLGDAQLARCPRSRGDLAVALGVGRGEVLARRSRRGRPGAGARAGRSAPLGSDSIRSSGSGRRARPAAARPRAGRAAVVTLMFSSGHSTSATLPPSALDQPGVVGCAGELLGRRRRAPARARRGGTPVASAPPTGRCDRASRARPAVASARLIVSRDGRGRDRAERGHRAAERGDHAARRAPATAAGGRRRGRARGRPDRRLRAPGAPTPSAPRRRRRRARPSGALDARGQREHDLLDRGDARAARRCSTASAAGRRARTSAFGRVAPRRSPLPAATIRATAIIDGAVAHAAELALPRA